MVEHVFERASAAQVADLSAALAGLGRDAGRKVGGVDAAELVDQLRALEELKAAAAAAQARVTVLFAAGQRAAQRQAGVRASQVGAGIAAQVGLARRDSPVRGSRHLGLAEALVAELPHTLAALEAGHISEWRATLVVRETACLSVALRRQVDAELAARPGGMAAMGDRTIELEARRVAYRLDPYAVADRARRAAGERRVTVRPAPDAMSWLTGTLPLAQGVAAYAALSRCADSARAAGDPRSRGQVMADTMVERLTGQASASAVPVEVNLTMTDTALLGGGDEPADLDGYGPVPAPVAREWLRGASEPGRAADGTGGTAGSGPSGGAGTSVGGASGIVASGVGASGVGASGVGASVGGVSGVGVSGGRGERGRRRGGCGGHRGRAGADVAPPAVHPPRDRRPGGDGVGPPLLRRRPASLRRRPRPELSHSVVRRPGPARRPPGPRLGRWAHRGGQRAGAVRGVQLRQAGPRLVDPAARPARRRCW